VNFGKKISIRNFIEDMGVPLHKMQDITESTKLLINESLCSKVLDSLSKNSVIMSTGPVAAVLLEFRKGISTEIMLKQVEYIYEELEARNAHVSEDTQMNRGSNHAMTLLNEFVKKKRDVFEPFVSPKVDYKNILMLAYYKNTIVHVFLKEMMIGKSNF
jgi:glycerol-3-phosphate O-acyltransferase